MPCYVSADLYEKHKDTILSLTNARQRYEPGKGLRGLTDREIAERLGVSPDQATEIRCIAELNLVESSRYFEADAWKEERLASVAAAKSRSR